MFRLSLSHLRAVIIKIHTKNVPCIVGSHNAWYILCMDLYHEGLKMTHMFRLSLSHLQALIIKIHTKNVLRIVGSHNAWYILCMDLYYEGLKMTQ